MEHPFPPPPTLFHSAVRTSSSVAKVLVSTYWQLFPLRIYRPAQSWWRNILPKVQSKSVQMTAPSPDNFVPSTHRNNCIRVNRVHFCGLIKFLIDAITFALQIFLRHKPSTKVSSDHSESQIRCQAYFRETQIASTLRKNCSRNNQGKLEIMGPWMLCFLPAQFGTFFDRYICRSRDISVRQVCSDVSSNLLQSKP